MVKNDSYVQVHVWIMNFIIKFKISPNHISLSEGEPVKWNWRVADLSTSLEHYFLMDVTRYLWMWYNHNQLRIVVADVLAPIWRQGISNHCDGLAPSVCIMSAQRNDVPQWSLLFSVYTFPHSYWRDETDTQHSFVLASHT